MSDFACDDLHIDIVSHGRFPVTLDAQADSKGRWTINGTIATGSNQVGSWSYVWCCRLTIHQSYSYVLTKTPGLIGKATIGMRPARSKTFIDIAEFELSETTTAYVSSDQGTIVSSDEQGE